MTTHRKKDNWQKVFSDVFLNYHNKDWKEMLISHNSGFQGLIALSSLLMSQVSITLSSHCISFAYGENVTVDLIRN